MKNLSRGIFLILIFIPCLTKSASYLDVVINEIAWMGTKIEGINPKNWWRYEWLELYNNTNQIISLEDWVLEFFNPELNWQLKLKGEITPKSYFLVVSSDKIFSFYDFNYSDLGGKIINSGQEILLKDSSGNIIDEIDCYSSKKWFAGENEDKKTMERISTYVEGSNPKNWKTSKESGGTPKAENSDIYINIIEEEKKEIKPLPQYPEKVILNEILPSPSGSDETEEWIEIFNGNDFNVNLEGWQIADTKGRTNSYSFPKNTIIPSNGFLIFSRKETKIILNNDKEEIILFTPDKKLVDSVSYEKAPRGKSYNFTSSGWIWSSILTPGSKNIVPESEESSKKSSSFEEKKEMLPLNSGEKSNNNLLSFIVFPFLFSFFCGLVFVVLKKILEKVYNK